MSKLVTIYGGSGFVGRYIARRMAKVGWRVRVAVRRPNEALFVRPYGVVGQVEPVLCNVRNEESVGAAMQGADAVVNCVGILFEQGRNTFDDVHVKAAERIASVAASEGVTRLVHLSSIGADVASDGNYARSKRLGEAAVLKHFPKATILRPSVIFGTEDQFFNRFAFMANLGLVLPLVGGDTKFQPVYVDDVAAAAQAAIIGDALPGVYELGGPNTDSLKGFVLAMLAVIKRRRLVLNMPFFVGWIMGFGFDMMQKLSGGLISNTILTRDQVRQLRHDNVVSEGAAGLVDLGVKPTPYETVIKDYLWRFRPAGEFSAIKDSAKNIKA